MQKKVIALVLLFLCAVSVSSQTVDKETADNISRYFKKFKSSRSEVYSPGLDKRKNNIVLNTESKSVVIYCNESFAGMAFTQGVVDTIYNDIRKMLPRKYRKYSIKVMYNGVSIDDRVPNIYRREDIDKTRLWGKAEYKDEPWTVNISRPYTITSGLVGRHLALWQSHGRFYKNAKNAWVWQRPPLYCTTEDLFTQSIVVPFLAPMLENAGATLFFTRERDWQPNCVIVDNDLRKAGAIYSEKTSKGYSWQEHNGGYANKKEAYDDGENPFLMGTSRFVKSSDGGKRKLAKAVWTPDIPCDGDYAVYVSYSTMEKSVPDARYTVNHSGGSTTFKVNQKMGGGTWVYLGTFHFKAGDSQNVTLTNESEYSGVVSADAVRFGGGTSCVKRGSSGLRSGLPRYLEGARYNLQLSGFPYEVYSSHAGEDDYRDDINCRSHAVNYLSGGSVYNPDTVGLNVPLELSFGFHSDAGFKNSDEIVGTLGIVTTNRNEGKLRSGKSRYMSRDMISYVLNGIQEDLTVRYGFPWRVRGILDRSYSESRLPNIPATILESLSHENYYDMVFGHDPDFKFTYARAVYKSLLKHLCYVHDCKYVVQPLPVTSLSLTLNNDDTAARLRWVPVEDPQEPTARPDRYVVYTRLDDGGYDNGTVVDRPYCNIKIEKGRMYSFKVCALNDGGQSMPSEELSLYLAKKEKGRVLVVNGFHRLSGPQARSDSQGRGFDMLADPGVPYMYSPEYCGIQYDFEYKTPGDGISPGSSGSEYEGTLVAGNTFNYPYLHGKSLAANGYSFVSCGTESIMRGTVNMNDYKIVDLILGVEKQGGDGSYLGYKRPYKTFPVELQRAIRSFCDSGGSIFVSGAFIASDMTDNGADRDFITDVLHYDFGGRAKDSSGSLVTGSGANIRFCRTVNENCYAVSCPDVLVPVGKKAFVSFVFDEDRQSAGIAYNGDYRVIATSIPFEAVTSENQRNKLMEAVMRYLSK